MKHLTAVAIGLLFVAAGTSQGAAGEMRPNDLALLVEARSRLTAQITTASVQRSNAQYPLLADRRQVDDMIAALEAGKNVDPERIERVLQRARVLQ